MSKILLDSSIIIDLLRREDKKKALLYQLDKQNYQLAISIITHCELYSGKSIWGYELARQELETILSGIEIVFLNEDISKSAGEIRAKYNINLLDAIIAATTLYYGLDLVTLNIKDFNKIQGIRLYEI